MKGTAVQDEERQQDGPPYLLIPAVTGLGDVVTHGGALKSHSNQELLPQQPQQQQQPENKQSGLDWCRIIEYHKYHIEYHCNTIEHIQVSLCSGLIEVTIQSPLKK